MALKQITRVNIAEKVFEQLRDQILQGTWKEGEKLPSEQELTETLGVSRSSVRQAIRMIEAGAEYVRFTAQGEREARNLGEIRKELNALKLKEVERQQTEFGEQR